MKYLLDTDHVSIIQRKSGPDYATLAPRIASHPRAELGLSIISFHEQVLGCHAYINRAKTATEITRGYGMLSRLLSDYSVVSVLPFDAAAAAAFDGLIAQRVRIGTMDLRIGAIALANGLILVTRNIADFRHVPGLITEDWAT